MSTDEMESGKSGGSGGSGGGVIRKNTANYGANTPVGSLNTLSKTTWWEIKGKGKSHTAVRVSTVMCVCVSVCVGGGGGMIAVWCLVLSCLLACSCLGGA
jgi:hypothetical protein